MSEMSMLNGMLITLVHIATEEELVKNLEKGLNEYKQAMLLATSDDERKKIFEGALGLPCLMLLIKTTGDDPMKMIRELSQLEKAKNLIKPNHN